ncbi:MAG: EAL domain-containing protein [Betaproteobacteria bacterium]|nr:EAL domain-containing protein [Betaproteobacteria bacterium]
MSAAAVAMPFPARSGALPGQRETADRLMSALRSEEFVLFAQPILPASPTAGDRPFQEILVRFLEEEEKLLPPGSFIPVLESFRLMTYLDRWALNRTARWLLRQPVSRGASRNALNLSEDTLLDPGFAAFVEKQIASSGIAGAALCFEVPLAEAISHGDPVLELAAALKPLGCALSLSSCDGSPGSMRTLELLKPEFVKIASGLIGRMDRDPMEAATVEGIHQRCRDLGIRTIAEHVERPQTLEIVRGIGIDYVQGYLVGRPAALS